MREDDSNWFTKWEDELPRPDELMPISQTLITRDLALAFDIRGSGAAATTTEVPHMHHHQVSGIAQTVPQPNSSEFDSSSAELGGGSGSGGGGGGGVSNGLGMAASDEPARTLKRPRLVWTPQLHKRFVDAVAHLGIKNAVPKTIMQLMSVDGLTRENVASHLQKYRLYLKRMQGLTNGNGHGPNGVGPGGSVGGSGDSATDRLFASSPVPPHFLHQSLTGGASTSGGGRPNTDSFMSYMPVGAAIHHQQMVSSHPHHIQAQYPHQHHRQMGHYGSPPIGSPHFDQQQHHLFVSRQAQNELLGTNRNGIMQISAGFVEDMESGTADDPRKILTLFPTSD